MKIGFILIFIIAFTVIFGGGSLLVILRIKKLDNETGVADGDMNTAQEFLPFKKIQDGVIDLGGNQYRAVIECSSTNYSLKTENEKSMIEASFQRFVNSLSFPVTFFIQTKTMSNVELLSTLKKEIDEMCVKHPVLRGYGDDFYHEMSNLEKYTENNRQKKKYIIVPYDECGDLEELSEKEKKEHSISEVKQRALVLIDSLSGMGIKGTLLDTAGLAELVYSSYHKDNFENVKNVISGEHLSLMVSGARNPQQEMTDEDNIDFVLYEAKEKLKSKLSSPYLDEESKAKYEETLRKLSEIETSKAYKGEVG